MPRRARASKSERSSFTRRKSSGTSTLIGAGGCAGRPRTAASDGSLPECDPTRSAKAVKERPPRVSCSPRRRCFCPCRVGCSITTRQLVQTVRASVLCAAAANGVALSVTTFVCVEPDDLPTLERFESIIQRHGRQVLPVFLQCSTAENVRCVGNVDRVEGENGLRARCPRVDSEIGSVQANARPNHPAL